MERRNAVYSKWCIFGSEYLISDIYGGCFESHASKTIADSTDVASKGSIGTRRMLFCLGQRKSFFGVL